jgi:UDP-N-acetylmuramoyl-tripeptide--D-alanyl-D-alanine ligase
MNLAAYPILAALLLCGQPKLTGAMLDESLALGREHLLARQREAGNFIYEFDFVTGRTLDTDNPVRQAGALWGLALYHQNDPSPRTAAAIDRGLDFFARHARRTDDGRWVPGYPGRQLGETNVVALLALAMIDYLRTDIPDRAVKINVERMLDDCMAFLLSLRRDDGQFWGTYRCHDGAAVGFPSPYADGEALLAMVKAARYTGRADLKPLVLESAADMTRVYITAALRLDPDSDYTKGFYQWGSMAFFEIADAGWDTSGHYANHTIELAHWMIDVHRTLKRTRNTGYAYEGLCVAYELARRAGEQRQADKFAAVINEGLSKLTTWQVGGPTPNEYLKSHPTDNPLAVGGVMNAEDEPLLRIDVVQHQMHALMLARKYVVGE